MGRLLDEQSDHDPIEFTHFDCWFGEEGDSQHHRLQLYCDASIEELVPKMLDIVTSWEQTLEISILSGITEHFDGNLEQLVLAAGWDNTWSLILMQILRHEYAVYEGSTFIEIY